MHVHVGALEFFVFIGNLLLAQFLLRALAAKYPDSTFGKALATIVA